MRRTGTAELRSSAGPSARLHLRVPVGTDATAVTAELAAKYGFSPKFVYNGLPGFAAVVSEQALAAIRCDSRVKSVDYDVFNLPGEG